MAATAATAAGSGELSLQDLRDYLLRLEETIIFALIERAHFARNDRIYRRGEGSVWEASSTHSALGQQYSFLEYFLRETERIQALLGRYNAEDENPFFPALTPSSFLPPRSSANFLKPNRINYNAKVLDQYLNEIVPSICAAGDDGHYGSSADADIICLQAISKRVHYGKQVAEVKFREQREAYTQLIRARDTDGLMRLLTNQAVEDRLLRRVRLKAATYGQEISDVPRPAPPNSTATDAASAAATAFKIDPDLPERIYRELLIPLTKDIEVEYLLQRLDEQCTVAYLGPPGTHCLRAAQACFSQGEDLLACDSIDNITKVYSHANVLVECQALLADMNLSDKCVPVASTAEGAQRAAEDPHAAALVSELALEMHPDLRVLRHDMQGAGAENRTRFLIISRHLQLYVFRPSAAEQLYSLTSHSCSAAVHIGCA
ncbi:uncharacterized protein MONBRDRAFT_10005 [Monosiga brevicollis MX1]|uniref:chorismate mutase n=1 Tax=Monosiga brevicollis TaxID=81824 RepID=A9V4X1_MONBE|nr:uncharacterized protein MONBRDRAFT_10005 [Monosiga brevicollis MX1]EDQ87529.1 predicted protein [Monosiga brevicollis MX1]|eukprot:XP_001747789.1 hypothetical protein [Monosiga brevicollis MX1]